MATKGSYHIWVKEYPQWKLSLPNERIGWIESYNKKEKGLKLKIAFKILKQLMKILMIVVIQKKFPSQRKKFGRFMKNMNKDKNLVQMRYVHKKIYFNSSNFACFECDVYT